MKSIKSYFRILLILLLILASVIGEVNKVSASQVDSYLYDIWDEAIPSPNAYEWEKSVRTYDLGIDEISQISDVFYQNGLVYITMLGKVVVTDEDFNTIRVITTFTRDGSESKVVNPKGIYVTKENEIYITEQDQGEIIHFDKDYNFIRAIGDPVISGLGNVKYAPTKVAVDEVGRIYVKAKSVYEGIIELEPSGSFSRFVGANEVNPSFVQRFYRLIATDEQIARMQLWLPTDYSDIALDKDGFLFATVKDTKSRNPVRKLNSSGVDIMNEYDYIRPPLGDYNGASTISTLTAVACAEDGRFAVLDTTRSRIFVYSEDAVLAYVVGGSGKREGNLNSPVDIAFMGDKILVADLVSNSIEVFRVTEYGALINEALKYQSQFDYVSAAKYWEQVFEINPYSLNANIGLGKYHLRTGDYEAAMERFMRVGERESYSMAKEYVREEFLDTNFTTILLLALALIIVIFIVKRVLKKLNQYENYNSNSIVKLIKKIKYQSITYPFYILCHPFKAFDDMKYLNTGSLSFSFIILILVAWSSLIKTRYAGFLVNFYDYNNINVPVILISSVFAYLVFILANWAIAVLIDGKGNMATIFKVNMYALYPGVFLNLLGVVISRYAIMEETAICYFLFGLSVFIYVFYTFIGLIVVHQFTFTKGVASVLLSFIAMMVILFIGSLLLTLVSGFIGDIITIFDEVMLRF